MVLSYKGGWQEAHIKEFLSKNLMIVVSIALPAGDYFIGLSVLAMRISRRYISSADS
jgi:hypothetical protein